MSRFAFLGGGGFDLGFELLGLECILPVCLRAVALPVDLGARAVALPVDLGARVVALPVDLGARVVALPVDLGAVTLPVCLRAVEERNFLSHEWMIYNLNGPSDLLFSQVVELTYSKWQKGLICKLSLRAMQP